MAGTKKTDEKAYAKSSRCWPGFEPVPGKGEHEQGSCRKKPASRNGGKEVNRETARHKQVAEGGARAEQAKGKSPSAAERRSVSVGAKKAAAKKTGTRTATKTTAAKRAGSGTRKTAAKKTGAKRAAGGARKTAAKKPTAAARKTAARTGRKTAAKKTATARG